MTATAWPQDLGDSLAAYAAALESLPGGEDAAAQFRIDLMTPQPSAWGLAQPLSLWGRYRPQALLARSIRSREAAPGMFGRFKRGWSKAGEGEEFPAVDLDNLFPWDDLAGPAAKVEVTLRNLPKETVLLARLGETLEVWPPAPSQLPIEWPMLRDAMLTALPATFAGPPMIAFVRRLLTAEKRTAEDVIAAGSSLTATWAYRALLAEQPHLLPELDAATLKPTAIPSGTQEEYREGAEPIGSLLRVLRFAVPPEQPLVLRSAGPKVPNGLALAVAPIDPRSLPPGPMRDRVVIARLACIQRLLNEDATTDAVVLTDAERAWVAVVGADPKFEAWYRPILRWSGLSLLPEATAAGFRWPEDVSLAQPGVTGQFDAQPLGTILSVERAALHPHEAEFTISLGPTPSAASIAGDLWKLPAKQPRLEAAARLVDRIWRKRTPTPQHVLDACDAIHASGSPESSAAITVLCDLAKHFDMKLLPMDQTTTFDKDAEETTGVRGVPVFRLNDPIGTVFRIRSYGLMAGGIVVRQAEVSVSVGVPPPYLTEMEKLLTRCPTDVAAPLKESFVGLRRAALDQYLEQAMIDLFQQFWNDVQPTWHACDVEGAAGFDGCLQRSLEQQFGLHCFEPRSVLEHPDGWAILPPGSRINSGRVRRILTPGLLDAAGGLRLPALVEAD